VIEDREMTQMMHTWNDTADERQYVRGATMLLDDEVIPPPTRRRWIIPALLALAIFGAVLPTDLYLANAFMGDPIPVLRNPMTINLLLDVSVAFAVPVIPLALLALLSHLRFGGQGNRRG
jgi:hypothetical protein